MYQKIAEHLDTEITELPVYDSSTPRQSFVEDDPEQFRKQLPQRSTRGILKPTYEPDFLSKINYHMSHYVSNHRLSESNLKKVELNA